jgi:hypothetical protein
MALSMRRTSGAQGPLGALISKFKKELLDAQSRLAPEDERATWEKSLLMANVRFVSLDISINEFNKEGVRGNIDSDMLVRKYVHDKGTTNIELESKEVEQIRLKCFQTAQEIQLAVHGATPLEVAIKKRSHVSLEDNIDFVEKTKQIATEIEPFFEEVGLKDILNGHRFVLDFFRARGIDLWGEGNEVVEELRRTSAALAIRIKEILDSPAQENWPGQDSLSVKRTCIESEA